MPIPQLRDLTVSSLFQPITIARILILSYFVGLASGLIGGTDLTLLTDPFLSKSVGAWVIGVLIISLCAFVLLGIQRRRSALLLSLILFWASYMTMHQMAVADVNFFWRDLALIGGLLFSAGVGDQTPDQGDRKYEQNCDDGVVCSEDEHTSLPDLSFNTTTGLSSQGDQPYRQDFDLARTT